MRVIFTRFFSAALFVLLCLPVMNCGTDAPVPGTDIGTTLNEDGSGSNTGPDVTALLCSTDADCDDSDPCSVASCSAAGLCTFKPLVGDDCDDGDCCTTQDVCGLCVSDECPLSGLECKGEMPDCNDDESCTSDTCSCDEAAGVGNCENTPMADGSACEYSENDCTSGDQCMAGQCSPGEVMDLDDNNPCTLDICVKGQVEHEPLLEGQCDDGNECTLDDSCYLGTCVGGPVIECVKPGCASSVSCVPGEGCVSVWMPEGSPCDDNISCTGNDVCNADHECQGETAEFCNDYNPCTADSCDVPSNACRHIPMDNDCEDDDPCTENTTCVEGVCTGPQIDCSALDNNCVKGICEIGECVTAPTLCDDNDPCTTGACDSATGTCSYVDVDAFCEDGDPCTINDQCKDGECVGAMMDCSSLDTECLEGGCQAGICTTSPLPGCLEGETCEVPFDLGKEGGTVTANLCDYAQDYEHEWCEMKGPELLVKFKANYKQGKLQIDKGNSFDQMVWNYRFIGSCDSDHQGYCYGPDNNSGPGWGGYNPNTDLYIAIGSADGSCGEIDFTVHAVCNAGCSADQTCTPQGKCCDPGTICTAAGECCDEGQSCKDGNCVAQ